MSFENFALIGNEPIDISILKREFFHHQQGDLDDPDQNVEFIFAENINYH